MLRWLRQKTEDFFGSGSRSGRWPRVRREHLEREPACIACGRSKGDLEVHHVVPYHENPELELDPGNLVTLCADPCHRVWGHLMNFKKINPHVREDAVRYRARMRDFGSVAEDE